MTTLANKIKYFVNHSPKPVRPQELSAYLNTDQLRIAQQLSYCVRRGYIQRVGRGLYFRCSPKKN